MELVAKLNDREIELYKKVQEITSTDYGLVGNEMPYENYEAMLEDVIYYTDVLTEKLQDLEQDLQDNYKPISQAEQIGYSNEW